MEMLVNELLGFLVSAGNKLLWCIVILIICGILLKIGRIVINRFFSMESKFNKNVNSRKNDTLKSVLLSVMKYTVYFIAIFSILTYLGVPVASLVTIAGVGSVAVGFGAQSLVQDLITGFFILLEDQYGVGDIVTIEGNTGTVEEITIRTTRIRGYDGTVYIIPNGKVQVVINMCKDYMNAVVDVDIDYHEDMDHVLKVLNDEMDHVSVKGMIGRPTVLGIMGLNESAVTVRIVAECEVKQNYAVERQLKLAIKKRLDKENISIPFPQRTVHIVENTKEV